MANYPKTKMSYKTGTKTKRNAVLNKRRTKGMIR